ncbi:hypothetical protein Patl1_07654 [Pistacia atlantica]|uniref:Uncharacterized protein n=1 Tax=Pistacia atlantica TaxID=434234 RepID=A0ACC1AIP3_9ROSI|nr:hypothetical protein Patl1_07654 [Pistacia atlantica]
MTWLLLSTLSYSASTQNNNNNNNNNNNTIQSSKFKPAIKQSRVSHLAVGKAGDDNSIF